MYLEESKIPVLVDLMGLVVDSMREKSVVSSFVEDDGVYTITSKNSLSKGEAVAINSVNYTIIESDGDSFIIEGALGIDFNGLEWKALAPYYEHGHLAEISQILDTKDGEYSNKKFPLIILIQNFTESNSNNTDFYATADPRIVIVNFTGETIRASERYEENFPKVLYPLYSMLLDAIYRSGFFNVMSSKLIPHNKIDSPYYGSQEYGKNAMTDPLDAIVMDNVELQMVYKQCKI